MKITIYTDGGARGNPGPAASGYVIKAEGKIVKEEGKYLGETTNNIAEYTAVLLALKKVKHLLGKEKIKKTEIEVLSDSELLVRQMNGEYKIENEELQKLFMEIWNFQVECSPRSRSGEAGGKIKFIHIPREKNKEADAMVNEVLDREQVKLSF